MDKKNLCQKMDKKNLIHLNPAHPANSHRLRERGKIISGGVSSLEPPGLPISPSEWGK